MRFLIGAALGAALFTSASAQDRLPLAFPLACTLGETCFITALMDHDIGSFSTDYSCGTLTRDDHSGTDFTLPDMEAMKQGVDVLSAARGTVVGVRDRLPDTGADYGDEDCGNGVAVSHGDGWVTQYCHMKLGSIAVEPGQRVATGDLLGQVGRSGAATLPHLHLSLRKDNEEVDPFAPGTIGCGNGENALWDAPLSAPAAGFLKSGFATQVPDYDEVKETFAGTKSLSAIQPIVAWVSGYGSRPGDIVTTTISTEAGLFSQQEETLQRRQEAWFRFFGRRYTDTPWPQGTYTATVTLTRQGQVIAETTFSAKLD
ncbi:MAG: M23 family metallopeptidase [Rhodobacteraceae bacterium]|nr:M23 family metallopeptidase [Paracoccaceae bacterium]